MTTMRSQPPTATRARRRPVTTLVQAVSGTPRSRLAARTLTAIHAQK